jgi:hypothetical protein
MGRRLGLYVGLVVGVFCVTEPTAQAQLFGRGRDHAQRQRAAELVPMDEVPPQLREDVRRALDKPTLFATGPAESFPCRPELYYWLLDHPDRATAAWRRLGATCLPITDRGAGRFGWKDDQGSDLVWETIHQTPEVRVWVAQGQVRLGTHLPIVPVRAVVVLRHNKTSEQNGTTVMSHQADVFVHTDSRTASLATKLMGPSAPRMAEQGVGQLQMFFSALAWYCQRHPEQTQQLLQASATPPPTNEASPVRFLMPPGN